MWRRWLWVWLVIGGCVWLPRLAHAQDASRFFPETNQTLDNTYGLLQFWEAHDGATMFGPPITDVLVENNVYVQYFEHTRLEARADAVVVGAVGRDYMHWRTFPLPLRGTYAEAQQFPNGHTLSNPFRAFWHAHDGVTLLGDPLSEAVWEMIGGASVRVQYFERGRLEQPVLGKGVVVVGGLGRAVALARGLVAVDQQPAIAVPEAVQADVGAAAFAAIPPPPTATPIPPTNTPTDLPTRTPTATEVVVEPSSPPAPPVLTAAAGTRPPVVAPAAPAPTAARPRPTATPSALVVRPTKTPVVAPRSSAKAATRTPPPTPTKPRPTATTQAAAGSGATSGKVIDVNLSKQWLYVYQDGVEVYRAPVATGKKGFETPTGTYNIYNKLPLRTMRGSENGENWVVPNVPNVMYVVGGVALHGTYWHNLFGTGTRMSHGCVNLSLKNAAWLYKWAPVGTKVVIHY